MRGPGDSTEEKARMLGYLEAKLLGGQGHSEVRLLVSEVVRQVHWEARLLWVKGAGRRGCSSPKLWEKRALGGEATGTQGLWKIKALVTEVTVRQGHEVTGGRGYKKGIVWAVWQQRSLNSSGAFWRQFCGILGGWFCNHMIVDWQLEFYFALPMICKVVFLKYIILCYINEINNCIL